MPTFQLYIDILCLSSSQGLNIFSKIKILKLVPDNGVRSEFLFTRTTPLPFQKAMHSLLCHLDSAQIHLNDVLIFSKTLEDYI